MNNELISIIVPVYNVEMYLTRCVESIIEQTYNNLEIILVDDGSTDNCKDICDEFQKKDKRIKVIHKSNGGLSDARNYGIDNCHGNFIMFIDSDDWIDKNYVDTYFNVIKKNNADLVIGKIEYAYSNNVSSKPLTVEKSIEKIDAYKEMFLGNGTIISACAKLYAKRIFEKNRFEYGKLYEDFLLFDKIIEKTNKIIEIDYAGYYYFIRNNSIMRSNFNEKRMVLIEKSEYYINFVQKKYPSLVNAAIRRSIVSCFNILSISILSSKNNEISKKIRKKIIGKNEEITDKKVLTKRDKAQIKILKLGIFPYRMSLKLYYLYKKIKKK